MRPFILAACLSMIVSSAAIAGAQPAPDNKLTPGAVRTGLTPAQIKKQIKERPALPSDVVREVAKRYGITLGPKNRLGVHDKSCGKPRCEIDHRIPWG